MRLSCPEQMLGERDLADKITMIADAGFSGLDARWSTLTDPTSRAILDKSSLPLASVYSQIREPSLLAAHAHDRAQAVAQVVERAQIAAEFGAANLIVVPIFGDALVAAAPGVLPVEMIETALLLALLNEITPQIANIPVTVVLEPLNGAETHFLREPATAAEICGAVGSPRIQTMVDTYHCHCEGQDIPDQIASVGEQLALVHLSDSNRGLPGEGEVDFTATISSLHDHGYDGWLGFECRRIVTDDDAIALGRSVALMRSLL